MVLIKKGGNTLSPAGGGGGQYPPLSPSRGFGGASPSPGYGASPFSSPLPPRASPVPPRASPVPPSMAPQVDQGQVSRLDALERRLAAMENNNRSMMAQFTQLQQEATVGVRRDAHAVSEQRESRGRMEMALRGAQQKLADVDHRIGRASNVLRETQSSIQAMAVQTNTMQNALAASGRDTEEMALARLQEARQEILDLLQYHDTSRKAATALREDMQNMRMKVTWEVKEGDK